MPRWTAEQTSTALRLLDKGYRYESVAAYLGRTADSVRKQARVVRPKNPALLNATQVAHLLGIVPSVATRLIKEGYLTADQQVTHGRYYITRRALEDFIRYCPERYDIRKITDPKLAVLAASPSIRSDKMLTLSEAANVLGLSRNYVSQMAREGILPGRYEPQPYRIYVPRTSVQQLLVYRRTWLTTKQAATQLGYNFQSIANLCRLRQLRAIKIGGVWYVDPQSVQTYKPKHPKKVRRAKDR